MNLLKLKLASSAILNEQRYVRLNSLDIIAVSDYSIADGESLIYVKGIGKPIVINEKSEDIIEKIRLSMTR